MRKESGLNQSRWLNFNNKHLKKKRANLQYWMFLKFLVLNQSVKYSQIQRDTRNTDDSRCSGMKRLFTSFDTRRERHNFYYADGSYITHNQLPSWTARPRVKSQLTAFSKITKNLSPLLPGMASFTPQSYFLSGVFIMTFVIDISSARECELYSLCACALSRIVQSPTKPNDKKTKND